VGAVTIDKEGCYKPDTDRPVSLVLRQLVFSPVSRLVAVE